VERIRGARAAGRNHAGFTLPELVIVIILLGVLSASVMPRMASITRFHERNFLEETLAALRHAQSVAVASGCPTSIDFSLGGLVVRQRSACDSGAFTAEISDPANNSVGLSRSAPSDVTLSSSLDPLLFDALGRVTDASGVVSSASIQINSLSILVEGETGFAYAP
jgi:MSHA pilin protein MshC